jgi:hypothetical protein
MRTTFEEELINRHFSPADRYTEKVQFKTNADITVFLETLSKKVNSNNIGKALKKLKFEKVNGYIDDRRCKGYYVIQSKNN